MDEQKGKYNRIIVITFYMLLVAWIAYLVARYNLDLEKAQGFLKDAVLPVLGYVLIKGPAATPIMNIVRRRKPDAPAGDPDNA